MIASAPPIAAFASTLEAVLKADASQLSVKFADRASQETNSNNEVRLRGRRRAIVSLLAGLKYFTHTQNRPNMEHDRKRSPVLCQTDPR